MKNLILKNLRVAMMLPALVIGLAFSASMVLPSPTAVASGGDCSTFSLMGGANCSKTDEQTEDLAGQEGIFARVTKILMFVIGALSVIMLIIGGIRYVISAGNDAHVKGAKNTILYAIVGIIVALLGYAAVNFVTQQFNSDSTL